MFCYSIYVIDNLLQINLIGRKVFFYLMMIILIEPIFLTF